RIGVDVGRKLSLEQAVEWAAANQVRFIDLQLDTGANALGTIDDRRAAAVRAACEKRGVRLGLHTASAVNVAEYVPYLADAVEEWRFYFEAISSPAFRLSFTANHAHLVPEGIAGFVEALGMDRVEEVRLADCFRNGDEVHLSPGQGDIDFADMFRR